MVVFHLSAHKLRNPYSSVVINEQDLYAAVLHCDWIITSQRITLVNNCGCYKWSRQTPSVNMNSVFWRIQFHISLTAVRRSRPCRSHINGSGPSSYIHPSIETRTTETPVGFNSRSCAICRQSASTKLLHLNWNIATDITSSRSSIAIKYTSRRQ